MTPLIQIEKLCKTYGDGFTALSNINLDIMEGEIIALLGPCLLYTSDAADE